MSKVFFYWGNEEMSWLRYMTLYSFRVLNPDWDITLYRDKTPVKHRPWQNPDEQDFFNFRGEDYAPKIDALGINVKDWNPRELTVEERLDLANSTGGIDLEEAAVPAEAGPSHRSNFFKWHMLGTQGGVYSDMDILFTRPISQFWETYKEYDTVLTWDGGYFLIGFMASSGSNEVFQSAYKSAHRIFNPKVYQGVGQMAVFDSIGCEFGDLGSASAMQKKYPNNTIGFFPMDTVYPYRYFQMQEIFRKLNKSLPEDCIGLHWFAGQELSQRANNSLHSSNYMLQETTISYFADNLIRSVCR